MADRAIFLVFAYSLGFIGLYRGKFTLCGRRSGDFCRAVVGILYFIGVRRREKRGEIGKSNFLSTNSAEWLRFRFLKLLSEIAVSSFLPCKENSQWIVTY